MKHSLIARSTALALLAVTVLPAMAADAEITGPATPSFESMDADGNGIVNQAEFRKAYTTRSQQRSEVQERVQDNTPRYTDFDTNRDGAISREEFRAQQQLRVQQRENRKQENRERSRDMQPINPGQTGRGMGNGTGGGMGGGMGGGKR